MDNKNDIITLKENTRNLKLQSPLGTNSIIENMNLQSEKRGLKDNNIIHENKLSLDELEEESITDKSYNKSNNNNEINNKRNSNDDLLNNMINKKNLYIRGKQIGVVGLKKKLDIENLDFTDVNYFESEKNLFLAKTSLKNYLFDEAIKYIDDYIKSISYDLSKNERDVIISCYKSYISDKKDSYNNLLSIQLKDKTNLNHASIITEVKDSLEKQIYTSCEKQIVIINKYIMPNCLSQENKISFLKLKADIYKYMSELSTGELLLNNKQICTNLYKEVIFLCKSLDNLNSIKLGTYLNFSVYCYEILQDPYIALTYASYAIKIATKEMSRFKDIKSFEDSKNILDLLSSLKNNIHEWFLEIERLEKNERKGGKV